MLTADEVKALLQTAVDAFPHGACSTCECFLGYVVQLRMESDAEGKALCAEHMVARNEIHKCLGCDPCPPGDLYAAHLRTRSAPNVIRL
jgi:hypothetical protein